MNTFRGVLAADNGEGELSARTHAFVAHVIEANAANYTAWHFRRRTLRAGFGCATSPSLLPPPPPPLSTTTNNNTANLPPDTIIQELEFTEEVGGTNPKNYQVWYHRRAVISMHLPSSDMILSELFYIDSVLEEDAKNYHAWSHRQWLVNDYTASCLESGVDLIKHEYETVEKLLALDWRNNSGWNHRWFLWNLNNDNDNDNLVVFEREAEYAKTVILADKHNESPFKYLRGVMSKLWAMVGGEGDELGEQIKSWVIDLRLNSTKSNDTNMPPPPSGAGPTESIHVLSLLCDISEHEGDSENVKSLCDKLKLLDEVRVKYWEWRKQFE